MQTAFTNDLTSDSDMAESEKIIRSCVHCGFCLTSCPTYLLLGDELDSPRGRIYLMKDMLETNRPADERTVKHVDRCLSCLSCATTCPSGVNYKRLVDHARAHIEETYRRPFADRALRAALAAVLPNPLLLRGALGLARLTRPFSAVLPGRLKALAELAPSKAPRASRSDRPQVFPAQGPRIARAALLTGCAQTVLNPAINAATIRFLTRHGIETVIAEGAGCCGALVHHLGKRTAAETMAAQNIEAWTNCPGAGDCDFIVANSSGCGLMLKDYEFLLRNHPALATKAASVSRRARDIVEIACDLDLKTTKRVPPLRVAYHSACALQHGQGIALAPVELLARVGFKPLTVPEGHICCGSAGSYNLLQPQLARRLRDRKRAAIATTGCDVVAAGNIGCITQILSASEAPPVAHTVEFLDWATGGLRPEAFEGIEF